MEPHLLSLDQTGIVLGLNGMAVGGTRRIRIPANLVCYSGSSGQSLDEGAVPNKYCGLIIPPKNELGAAVRKVELTVEATPIATCRPVFLHLGPFHLGQGCRDSACLNVIRATPFGASTNPCRCDSEIFSSDCTTNLGSPPSTDLLILC